MKIALIAEAYPPMDGGVATSAQRLSREIAKTGNEMVVCTYDHLRPVTGDDFWYEEFDCGVHVYRVGPFFLKNKTLKSLPAELSEKNQAVLRRRAYGQMLTLLKKEKPDIILSFYLLNSGWIAQMLANELGLPCVAGVRGNDIGRNIFHTERFGVIKWVVDEADAVVSVNEFLYHRATNVFREIKNKTITIPNGFDCTRPDLYSIRDRSEIVNWGWNDNDLVLTFIGTLREKKGVATLLKSLKQVNEEKIHVRLLVVGPSISGVEKVAVGNIWNELVDSSIIQCTGQLPRSEVIYNASVADVVCIPSLDDGMANGLLEGMAAGLCPLTTTVLGDVVQGGENGIIVDPGDVKALCDAIEYLYLHRDKVVEYGQRAAKHVRENFKPSTEAQKYINLFQSILEARK